MTFVSAFLIVVLGVIGLAAGDSVESKLYTAANPDVPCATVTTPGSTPVGAVISTGVLEDLECLPLLAGVISGLTGDVAGFYEPVATYAAKDAANLMTNAEFRQMLN